MQSPTLSFKRALRSQPGCLIAVWTWSPWLRHSIGEQGCCSAASLMTPYSCVTPDKGAHWCTPAHAILFRTVRQHWCKESNEIFQARSRALDVPIGFCGRFDQPRAFAEFARVLKPGGVLAAWGYDLYALSTPFQHPPLRLPRAGGLIDCTRSMHYGTGGNALFSLHSLPSRPPTEIAISIKL